MRSRAPLFVVLSLSAALFPMVSRAQVPDPAQIPAGRETEAVVVTGASFPEWATLGDIALKANSIEGLQCLAEENGFPNGIPDSPVTDDEACTHNEYEDPDVQSSDFVPPANATPVDRLLGYRWNGTGFEQIPFQVDEMFVHYISNDISGFAFYSETDQHTTYAFDREGFRWTDSDPDDPCLARPRDEVAADPVPGLDTDDELVFMARDAGPEAPSDAALPKGVEGSYRVVVTDPTTGARSFVYVMKAAEDGPGPAFDESTGYVRYERDADSNVFLFSESSFENYGRAHEGPWFDPDTGVCHSAESEWLQHRPGDQATITTPRYSFRYEGRWLMTELHVSEDEEGDWTYGPDVIDQWKARAFQQRPGGETPCCGYEEEVNNWGGSSILMGELSGPVRTIRETWGADSGTNVVRREIFYRDEIRFISFLRVHVIPPADGIYSQWDYNAGIMKTYFNPLNPDGVPIDGCNDDIGNSRVYANSDGVAYDPDGKGPHPCDESDQQSIGSEGSSCDDDCIDNDIDNPDPVFSGVNAGLNWEQISGPHGTLVSRYQLHKATPGSAHSAVTVPYYRDDSCFDDGTGSNPGPHLNPREVDDGEFAEHDGVPRECWSTDDGTPPETGDPRFWQASIGTHGVHILLIADSDNAHTTVPVTEIDGDQRVVVLPGEQPNVGERYGRQPEKPLVVVAIPENRPPREPADERPTTVEITGDLSGDYSDTATLQARLTDTETGEGLPNETITFELTGADGTRSWAISTDGSGTASQTIELDRPPGSYSLVAIYEGRADGFSGDTDEEPFVIEREDTDLALASDGRGSRFELLAALTDRDSGAGIEQRTIEFFADGTSIGAATTDGDGNASLEPPPRYRNGHHDYEARFAGDDFYSAASAAQRT